MVVVKKQNNSTSDFERRLWAQTQHLQIFKKFYMSQMNPKENLITPLHTISLTTLHSRSVHLNL